MRWPNQIMLTTMTKIRFTRPAILYATGEATLNNEKAMMFWLKWTVPLNMKDNVSEVGLVDKVAEGAPKR